MKVDSKQKAHTSHPWFVTVCVVLGLALIALAFFLIKKWRSSSTQKHEYSALKTESGVAVEKYQQPNHHHHHHHSQPIRSSAYLACQERLATNRRYELCDQLSNIGSRPDKNWFTVQDTNVGAERLLVLLPLPSVSPIQPDDSNKETLLGLFRGLQHPYIHPVLDIEFWDKGVALITPPSPDGSLRDLIHGSTWHDDYCSKYTVRGTGLPMRTIQCLGRQILEGLLFLRNRDFPPFRHLHSGNVIIQNGVARLAGLENTLFGLAPRPPSSYETVAFGYLLFEMATGYELSAPPSQAHFQLELERSPKLAEALEFLFGGRGPPALEEVIRCDLFRGVELRELRGATVTQSRLSSDVQELLRMVRNPVPPSPIRRRLYGDSFQPWFA